MLGTLTHSGIVNGFNTFFFYSNFGQFKLIAKLARSNMGATFNEHWILYVANMISILANEVWVPTEKFKYFDEIH